MSEQEVLRIGIRRRKFGLLAVLIALLFLPFPLLFAWRLAFAGGLVFADALILAGGVIGIGFTVVLGGVAIRNPVGLRLDRHGISGYAAPAPLRWSDIAGLELVRFGRATAVAIWLHDPAAYRASLTPWQRLVRSGQVKGAHASVNVLGLAMRPEEVLTVMQRFWERHRGGVCP